MNIPQKAIESAAFIAARAKRFADAAAANLRQRADLAGEKFELSETFAKLRAAGGELHKIARHHSSRFLEQNASLAKAAGKDLSDLGRSFYSGFSQQPKPAARRARKSTAKRKRAVRKAA